MANPARYGLLAIAILTVLVATSLTPGKPKSVSAITLRAPTPGPGAMTVYSVTN